MDASFDHSTRAPEVRSHLFIDLEDTVITPVIEGWWKTELINIDKVKAVMAKFQPDFLHIFSFAIWNVAQREQFNQAVRPMLEAALGMQFSLVPTVDEDILPVCCKVMGLQRSLVDFQEMSNFWGKHEAFRLCMRNMFSKTREHGIVGEVMLLDDAVFNETFMWPDLQVKGCILNIDEL
jgi:hypothetical protein